MRNRIAWMFIAAAVGVAMGPVPAAGAEPGAAAPVPGRLEVESLKRGGALGFGWSHGETLREDGRGFRWVEHLEADLFVELDEVQPLAFEMTAAPYPLNWRDQRVGLFCNGRFIRSWSFDRTPDFRKLEADIPAEALRPGANRLILRAAYRYRAARENRMLSFAVDRVVLWPASDGEGPG